MAAVVGPTTPVWVVTSADAGADGVGAGGTGIGGGCVVRPGHAGGGRSGCVFLRETVAPVLAAALAAHDEPVDVLSLAAQAVAMGDDVHVRTQAATNLLLRHAAAAS